jgi:hypothetical protein
MFGQDLVVEFAGLMGFAALVAVVINILKTFKVIGDGAATKWSTGLNLAGLVALMVYRFFQPETPVTGIDSSLASIANILTVVLAFVVQLGTSKVSHLALKGTPLIGKSYTLDRQANKIN